MATTDIIAGASDPVFYTRVSFISLKTAQNVASEDPSTPNHENRTNYAERIFRGGDNALLISMHIAASNPTIAAELESGGGAAVPDGDIEYALATIWDSRANAFEGAPMESLGG